MEVVTRELVNKMQRLVSVLSRECLLLTARTLTLLVIKFLCCRDVQNDFLCRTHMVLLWCKIAASFVCTFFIGDTNGHIIMNTDLSFFLRIAT